MNKAMSESGYDFCGNSSCQLGVNLLTKFLVVLAISPLAPCILLSTVEFTAWSTNTDGTVREYECVIWTSTLAANLVMTAEIFVDVAFMALFLIQMWTAFRTIKTLKSDLERSKGMHSRQSDVHRTS